MLNTFDGPYYTKNEKYMKRHDCNQVFHVFLIFCVGGSICNMGTPWMSNQILHPMSVSAQNLSKPIRR